METPLQKQDGNPESAKAKHDASVFVEPPQLNLPKGGGAIRSIGEKFSANPVSGAGAMSVPIATPAGRGGSGPQLSLSYDSSGGNGLFGLGWRLSLAAVTRKTDKGLPRYRDEGNIPDVFILSGVADLAPVLAETNGEWLPEQLPVRSLYGQKYRVRRYRPRIEASFSRIEHWLNLSDPADSFWRSISRDNATTWYGKTAASRIADPADPSHIFSWLACEGYDDKGNAIVFQYKADNSQGVDTTQASERNRTDLSRSAARHIKHIYYGNRTPYFPVLSAGGTAAGMPADWCFEVLFDYGEHDPGNPLPAVEAQTWPVRHDPFSSYRAGFEVRSYRRCQRVLAYHHFENEKDVGLNCLVQATGFTYSDPPADPLDPAYSFLNAVSQTGYARSAAGYNAKSRPPLAFEYSRAAIDETVRDIDSGSLENLPSGLDGSRYQWVDLDGEGLSGLLSEQGGRWYYKANLSPANLQADPGDPVTLPRFAPTRLVRSRPAMTALAGGRQQLVSLAGNGHLDLVEYDSASPGFHERSEEGGWEPFKRFDALPVLDWKNRNLKFIDLTGDGFPDLLISEDDAFCWHASLAKAGFGPAQRVLQSFDEEKGPRLVLADSTETIFLADMSGDGLSDLVRIRNGEVCYWPNLGYGRFGAKVCMDNAPLFEAGGLFSGRRIRLADIDGSGTCDIVYFASAGVQLYFNLSGNGFSARRELGAYPAVDSVSSATALDLLGNGTACLVWSSPLPGNGGRSMRYIDLMGGQKPHLLTRCINNLGAETRIGYAPSTRFYVEDKLAGRPWITRIPFPVQVVARIEIRDWISRNLFVSRYAYHHGYFDGVEREFNGFGMVEQWDSEELGALTAGGDFPAGSNIDQASYVPPVLTRTWFHTGFYADAARIGAGFRQAYYREANLGDAQAAAMQLDDTALPAALRLSDGTLLPYDLNPEEARQACRALKGSILRKEVYALDGSEAEGRPYSVAEHSYAIEVLQPQGGNPYAVYFTHAREIVDFAYERKLFKVQGGLLASPGAPAAGAADAADPRVSHTLTLDVDAYGNVLESVTIGYGRRYLNPALTPADQAQQSAHWLSSEKSTLTNAVASDDCWRTPLSSQSSLYQLLNLAPDSGLTGATNLFRWQELRSKLQTVNDGLHDLPYEKFIPDGALAGQPCRRLVKRSRTVYRPDDLGAAAGGPATLLPMGQLQSSALPGSSYRLAFSPGLLTGVYQRGATALLPHADTVLGGAGADSGGYMDLDGDGNWWAPSGRSYYSSDSNATAQQELSQARQHFYQPRRFVDPFGNTATLAYDPYDYLPVQMNDAVGNSVAAQNDYRVLQPALLTDPNGNRTAACFDSLGMVAGTAVMGKASESLGDSFATFTADLTQQQLDAFYNAADPHTAAADLLGTATTRIIYDLDRFAASSSANPGSPGLWQPSYAATLARETHAGDPAPPAGLKIQIGFSYSDGFSREIQQKRQAEPGPVAAGGPDVNPRWIGSGWSIFNNKGKPVRQYEPFFSQAAAGHRFEFGMQIGISPVLFYDPLSRAAATLRPDSSYSKVMYDPWQQTAWDVNDTTLLNPKTDPDVSRYFTRLADAEYLPTWYQQRIGGALGAAQQAAAQKTAQHAGTPAVIHLDSLGRLFLNVADNGVDSGSHRVFYAARTDFDIAGQTLAVRDAVIQAADAQGRLVVRYGYNMLGKRIHQASMEAGERWLLNDVRDKPIRAWDSRGHATRTEYDALRRQLHIFVRGSDAAESDPRTLAAEVMFGKTVYGEGQPNDQAGNLRTRVYQVFDTAGTQTNRGADLLSGQVQAYDFKGNLLCSQRQLLQDHQALPDWSQPLAPASDVQVYVTSTRYDALNRPVAVAAPDQSITVREYSAANLLKNVSVNLQGAATATAFVKNIAYDAKGQRISILYGNGVQTAYSYDKYTSRLTSLASTQGAQVFQDLSYAYDPMGNVTGIADAAQQAIFFNGQVVLPQCDYVYDAVYRLINATGREHIGQLAQPEASWNDEFRVNLPQPGDGQAMRNYTEQYLYDAAGNMMQLTHQAVNGNWTRTYAYNEQSLNEAVKYSNRLSSTTVGAIAAPYAYDVHGNVTGMPHLTLMQWDFTDHLHASSRQAVNPAPPPDKVAETTFHVYDSGGQRLRKVTERQNGSRKAERIYLDGFEIYREFGANGTDIAFERETLHVMGDKQRIALVETRTQGKDGSARQLMRYQLGNHLGSASIELTDKALVISYEEYSPYGSTSCQAVDQAIKAAAKRYRYTGKERDEESGFYYHGARYYAAWLGRWISCDPQGIADGANLYQYGRCSPVRLVDPKGTQSVDPQRFQLTPPSILDTRTAEERFAARFAGTLSGNLQYTTSLPAAAPTSWLHPDPSAAGTPLPPPTSGAPIPAASPPASTGPRVTGGAFLPYLQIDTRTLRIRLEAGLTSAEISLLGTGAPRGAGLAPGGRLSLRYQYGGPLTISSSDPSGGGSFSIDPSTRAFAIGFTQRPSRDVAVSETFTSSGGVGIAIGGAIGPHRTGALPAIGPFVSPLRPTPGGSGLSYQPLGDPFVAGVHGVASMLGDAPGVLADPRQLPGYISRHSATGPGQPESDFTAVGRAVDAGKAIYDLPRATPTPDVRWRIDFQADPTHGVRAWGGIQVVY